MHAFHFHRAMSVEDALARLAEADDPKLLAGGQTLLPTMKQRLAMPSDLIAIGGIEALGGIASEDGGVRVGAACRHAEVAASALLGERLPALARLAGRIGDPQVRNRGTLGGAIANADPGADYPAAVLGLGALVHTHRRSIAADDFFTDLFETALDEQELVTAVTFPAAECAAYAKFANPASGYAIVGVFVARVAGAVRVAVTGAGACATRQSAMEAALEADFTPAALEGIDVDAADLNDDLHASADYRAHLVGVLARRAVADALG